MKLKRLRWKLCTVRPGSLGLQCTCWRVDCQCTWMGGRTHFDLPVLSAAWYRSFIFPGAMLKFSRLHRTLPIDPSSLLCPRSAEHYGRVESLDTSQFLLRSASSRHSRRKRRGPKGRGGGNLHPPASADHFGEYTHFSNTRLCACVSSHFFFLTQSFCPGGLSWFPEPYGRPYIL